MPLLLLMLLHHAAAASQDPAAPSWSNFRAAGNQQSLQTVLISIEERLRALDTLYSPRYTPRWEISIEQQSRRMETIESRLGRLETLLEIRLDKLSESISARQLKEELSKDQINRKLDSTYERLNHRLGYLEARLDSTIDTGIGQIERLEATAGRQNDIEAELADIGTGIDDIKKHVTAFEDQHNRNLVKIIENEKHMTVEMGNLTALMEDLHVEFNKTQAVSEMNDGEGTDFQEALKNNMNLMLHQVISSIDKNANNFMTKANNMYNDMWRRTQLLEGLVKDSMSLSNATRRELQDGIRTIAVQMGRRGLIQSDRDRQEGSMDIALDTLGLVQRRLNELGRKFDSSFQMLMLAQNLFLESCHRIQLDEPQLEGKLTQVLERILDAITNRSINTDREVQMLHEALKSHSSHLTRTLSQATNTILQASDQSNEDRKHLQLSIVGVKEQLLESNKYIEEAISDIKEEEAASTEKLYNIAASLQELQESIAEMSTTNIVAKEDRDKYKDDTADCPDNEQIAIEILAELKRKGVTVKHKITDENITAETITGKDTETENDNNCLLRPEDGFGEDTAEETEGNTNNREVESMSLQTLKSLENTSEEENDDDEILVEGAKHGSSTANINQIVNSSTFQRQHRFDLQTTKNSTNDSIKPAQVTIQIIPHNINLQLENEDYDKLLGLELHNFAAIIQDLDSTANQQRPQPTLSIVHAIASNDKNNTNVAQTNMGKKDVGEDFQQNINAALHDELNYINGTFAYNQSQNLNSANNTGIRDIGIPAAINNKESKNYSSDVSQLPEASAISVLIIKQHKNKSSDVNHLSQNILLTNQSSDTSSHNSQTFNISEKQSPTTDSTISVTNISHTAIKNITQSNSNYTYTTSEVQVPSFLKRLMELYTHEGKDNRTLHNFWINLLARKQLSQDDKNDTSVVNNFIFSAQNNSENQDTARIKHKPSTIFSIDAIQNMISALNDTKDRHHDTQQQLYLSRLQELATELTNMKNGSALEIMDHFKFTNITDEIKGTTSEEGNR
ncbi:uncharacterized protein LOC110835983 isoform X2 [Zootermopsis nevadensis]|uniref:uncharacterized protein LOC110835983 isoform X2 n=1 Tax=Zootermopsis nevadensis TaxID=136037 RepID=UPI000B8EC0FF|nr:uncharacterized protein LOC110835983 isoform X2 [Zootermopsis nevadensis]